MQATSPLATAGETLGAPFDVQLRTTWAPGNRLAGAPDQLTKYMLCFIHALFQDTQVNAGPVRHFQDNIIAPVGQTWFMVKF